MKRPRIKRTTERIQTPEGDVLLLRPSLDSVLRVEGSDEDMLLLASLDGTRPVTQLCREFGEPEVMAAIEVLEQAELLEDGADDDLVAPCELERLDRQLRYFSDITTNAGPTAALAHERLRAAKVAVLGVGGLGGRAAMDLACIGVGEMRLVDGDKVELSNLNRQVLYCERDIGRVKVEVAAERLADFNSSIEISAANRMLSSVADIEEAIADTDIVIDAVDWPAHDIERWCNEACFKLKIPYITMSHFPPIARVGPLYVPGSTGCYACQETQWRRDYPLFDLIVDQRRAKVSPAGNLGPACGLIGGQVAIEVMHHLTGLTKPSTLGSSNICDLRTMEVKQEPVIQEPDCAICA
jgi:molybdopterin/thiamine biosynthesis adenylyltransferase